MSGRHGTFTGSKLVGGQWWWRNWVWGLQDENEEEEDLLDQLSSALTAILREYGDAAMPLLDGLMPQIGQLLDPARSPAERRIGVCIIDDLLEHSQAGPQLQTTKKPTRNACLMKDLQHINPAAYQGLVAKHCSVWRFSRAVRMLRCLHLNSCASAEHLELLVAVNRKQ